MTDSQPPKSHRPTWHIIAISALISAIVSLTTVFAYHKLKPEPEPTMTEQIMGGVGDLFGSLQDIDGEDLQMIGQLGSLLNGGSGSPQNDLEQVFQMAEMAFQGMEMLGGLEGGGLEGLEGLAGLEELLENPLGQMEDAFMEGLQEGLGGIMGGLDDLSLELGDLDLSGLLGGGDPTPSGDWEVPQGEDGFDGLQALDDLLEGQ